MATELLLIPAKLPIDTVELGKVESIIIFDANVTFLLVVSTVTFDGDPNTALPAVFMLTLGFKKDVCMVVVLPSSVTF
jgi:hypothetical protein